MLFCLERLEDAQGKGAPLAAIMPGEARLQPRLAALGLQSVAFAQGTLRGHTFHFSRLATPLVPALQASNPNGGAGEAVFRHGALVASYVHFYFPSAPVAAASLFQAGLAA
jgi:cobyrinic acid a,c-diamide synthase